MMLTKAQLLIKKKGDYYCPLFLDPLENEISDLVGQIHSTCLTLEYSSQDELLEVLSREFDFKWLRGFIEANLKKEYQEKTLNIEDRAVFFLEAEKLRRDFFKKTYEEWVQTISLRKEQCSQTKEVKMAWPSVAVRDLIVNYNIKLCQSLLWNSTEMECSFKNFNLETRRLFVRLTKFWGLHFNQKGPNEFSLSGLQDFGLSHIQHKQRLTKFFKSLTSIRDWEIKARYMTKSKTREILIQEGPSLGRNLNWNLSYIPREFDDFLKNFAQKNSLWSAEWCDRGVQAHGRIHTPDFLLKHKKDGRQIYVELFHKWHTQNLKEQLMEDFSSGVGQYIFGVCKTLTKDPEIKEMIDKSTYFEKIGFVYRDFPTVELILRQVGS
jgi:predicted nuclease of restriction endonuclease-like RecB superfamily